MEYLHNGNMLTTLLYAEINTIA